MKIFFVNDIIAAYKNVFNNIAKGDYAAAVAGGVKLVVDKKLTILLILENKERSQLYQMFNEEYNVLSLADNYDYAISILKKYIQSFADYNGTE